MKPSMDGPKALLVSCRWYLSSPDLLNPLINFSPHRAIEVILRTACSKFFGWNGKFLNRIFEDQPNPVMAFATHNFDLLTGPLLHLFNYLAYVILHIRSLKVKIIVSCSSVRRYPLYNQLITGITYQIKLFRIELNSGMRGTKFDFRQRFIKLLGDSFLTPGTTKCLGRHLSFPKPDMNR
jgi:hypothetical protein